MGAPSQHAPDGVSPVPPHAQALVLRRMFGASEPLPRVGRYALRTIVGRGAQGVVYEAYDPKLRRTVALKLITTLSSRDPRSQARIRREARTLAALDHPDIVRIYDWVLEPAASRPYVVMEFVDGTSLRRWVEVARHGHGPTAAADQYAVCVSLYEMLTKRAPFRTATIEGLAAAKCSGVLLKVESGGPRTPVGSRSCRSRHAHRPRPEEARAGR